MRRERDDALNQVAEERQKTFMAKKNFREEINKVNKKILPKTSTVNLELSSYITSIVNQCRPYADSRRIQLTVSECSDCVSCRINENIMTAALQHLISKLILGSDLGCCISINITHTTDSWQLQITNCEIADKRVGKMFRQLYLVYINIKKIHVYDYNI